MNYKGGISLEPVTVSQVITGVLAIGGAGGVAWILRDFRELKGSMERHERADFDIQTGNVQRLAALETMVREIHRVVVASESER